MVSLSSPLHTAFWEFIGKIWKIKPIQNLARFLNLDLYWPRCYCQSSNQLNHMALWMGGGDTQWPWLLVSIMAREEKYLSSRIKASSNFVHVEEWQYKVGRWYTSTLVQFLQSSPEPILFHTEYSELNWAVKKQMKHGNHLWKKEKFICRPYSYFFICFKTVA